MDYKAIDKRKNVRTVTSNDFITASGLPSLSLKARKLLYLAISQCRQSDKDFYEYELSVREFADLMGIDASNVYRTADEVSSELMTCFIRVDLSQSTRKERKYSLFSYCEYEEDSYIRFKLNSDMTRFLLDVQRNFSQPLLIDFLKMKSPYSMAIWHLMQRQMQSKKPKKDESIEFELSLEELRKVTGCEDKLVKISQFKDRVLDKALREIRDNCGVDIVYDNVKDGRVVTGFLFRATGYKPEGDLKPVYRWYDSDNIPDDWKARAEFIALKKKRWDGPLSEEEEQRYQEFKDIFDPEIDE